MQPPMFTPEMQQRQDSEHLRLLAIFHFIVAGLSVLGLGFLVLHYTLMSTVIANPQIWKKSPHPPPFTPEQFMAMFVWFYVIFGVMLILAAVLNLFSGLFLLRRRHRVFSIVVAALNCLQVPFGTILGVFTILVLSRESVSKTFEEQNLDPFARQGF
jgi:hypothetical protein